MTTSTPVEEKFILTPALADLEIGRRSANATAKNKAARTNTSYTPVSVYEALDLAGIILPAGHAYTLLSRKAVELAEAQAFQVTTKKRGLVYASTPRAVVTPKQRAAAPAPVKPAPKAQAKAGIGSRGGNIRHRLASEQAKASEDGYSYAGYRAYLDVIEGKTDAKALTTAQVKSALRKMGFTVA